MEVMVSDLDGTLANIDHRLHHVQNRNARDWQAFNKAIPQDGLNEGVALTIRAWHEANYTVVLCSGRSEDTRGMTVKWLYDHNIPYDYLFMRKSGDHRKDSIIKQEMLDMMRYEYGFEPALILDDRPQVVQMWRDNGIMVGQVADWRPSPMEGETPPELHILIGPSGAGKSTWKTIHNASLRTVSTDDIRKALTGDALDQTLNNKVFVAFHHLIKEHLRVGVSVIADATNIRRKDRLAIKALATPRTKVFYHVFNRPMEEKVRDGGWRNNVPGLMERHEETFKQNLKWILSGDDDSTVTVIDHRGDNEA